MSKNPRLNVTVPEETAAILSLLAKQEVTSVSHIARDLIIEALERREDTILSKLSDDRDTPGTKKVSHRDAWK
jgi:hypothetical protein